MKTSGFRGSPVIRRLISFIVLIVLVVFVYVPLFDIGNTAVTDNAYVWGFDGLSTWDKHASKIETVGLLAYFSALIIQIILIIIRSKNGRFALLLVLSNLMIFLCIFSTILSSVALSGSENVIPGPGALLLILLIIFRCLEYIIYVKTVVSKQE